MIGRIAGMLLVTGMAMALLFDGLIAIAGAGLLIGGGVMLALALEDSVPPAPSLVEEEIIRDPTPPPAA